MQIMNAGASQNPACDPTFVYPTDGVLLPPNMNVVEVHFLEGSGNNLFEISFENGLTDVRVYTSCAGPTAAEGVSVDGGCVFELSQADWDYVARSNADGDPVLVSV